MTASVRALIGAIMGALLVLLAHPQSRPYLLAGTGLFRNTKVEDATRQIPDSVSQLPEPVSLTEASMWLQAGSEAELAGRRLSLDDRLLLAELAQQGARAEPDNAFWAQMESVFLWGVLPSEQQRKAKSYDAWARAARCTHWDDHQTQRLTKVARDLDFEDTAEFSWHLALAQSKRSSAVCQLVLLHSRALMAKSPVSLALRADNVRNGILVRDGARSIEGANAGEQIVQLAILGLAQGQSFGSTPRSNQEAQGRFLDSLKGDTGLHGEMAQTLAVNDAWMALVPTSSTSQRAITEYRTAVLVSTLPGALLACGILGIALLAFSQLAQFSAWWQSLLSSPWCFVLGAVAGFIVFTATGLVFLAVWVCVALGAFGLEPDRLRAGEVSGLGVVFRTTLAALALGTALAATLYLVSTSDAGRGLGYVAALPANEAGTSLLPLYLAGLGLTLVFATAPAWGFLYRFPATSVLPHSLRTFGGHLALGGLFLAVVSAPVCMALDKSMSVHFSQTLLNEPSHYASQAQ